MVRDAEHLFDVYRSGDNRFLHPSYFQNGAIKTLVSYSLLEKTEKGYIPKLKNLLSVENMERFKDDIEWMKHLPIYIELDIPHPSGKPVIVSHAGIANAWRKDPANEKELKKHALWNRDFIFPYTPIFNIFGHTPKESVDARENDYVNVDTECYSDHPDFGKLSAYCVESREIVFVKREQNNKSKGGKQK